MTSKKEIERKVDHLEDETDDIKRAEKSLLREILETQAEMEGKDPSEIEENSIGGLIRRARIALEET